MAEATPTVVELDEASVPGAFLSKSLQSHNVAALRMWLLCHDVQAPTSMTKNQLIERFI